MPFVVACSHFTRKNTRFRIPISSPMKAPCNIHITITMHFATSRRKPAHIYAYGQDQMTRIMQLFRCDLQPQIAKHPIITHGQSYLKQLEATIAMRQRKKDKPTQPQPPYTGDIISCSGFLLNANPIYYSYK